MAVLNKNEKKRKEKKSLFVSINFLSTRCILKKLLLMLMSQQQIKNTVYPRINSLVHFQLDCILRKLLLIFIILEVGKKFCFSESSFLELTLGSLLNPT